MIIKKPYLHVHRLVSCISGGHVVRSAETEPGGILIPQLYICRIPDTWKWVWTAAQIVRSCRLSVILPFNNINKIGNILLTKATTHRASSVLKALSWKRWYRRRSTKTVASATSRNIMRLCSSLEGNSYWEAIIEYRKVQKKKKTTTSWAVEHRRNVIRTCYPKELCRAGSL
jgi:hypothetical protein